MGFNSGFKGLIYTSTPPPYPTCIFSPKCPDQTWTYPAPYSMGIEDYFPGSKTAPGMKLITHLQLKLRFLNLYLYSTPVPHMPSWLPE